MDNNLQTGHERRHFTRARLKALCSYSQKYTGYIKDISEGGMCLITERKLIIEDEITFKIVFPDITCTEISSFGTVIWSKKYNQNEYLNGIYFSYLSKFYREKIKKFIKNKSKNN